MHTLKVELNSPLREVDPELYGLIRQEYDRVMSTVQLIASENFPSRAVLEATGAPLQHKYSEGYPYLRSKKSNHVREWDKDGRYYEGNQVMDQIERLAIERAQELFGAEYANVQLFSGAPANECAYAAFLQPGDHVMAMDLANGGHLTHGSPVNFSGQRYNFMPYGVLEDTGLIDYDKLASDAKVHMPKMIVAGATAYPRQVDFKRFREICDSVGAMLLVDMSHFAGLVAGKAHPTPIGIADITTTTTHKTLRGPRGALILSDDEKGKAIDRTVFPGIQAGPHLNEIAAKAVCFYLCMQPEFREYARKVIENARFLGDEMMKQGFKLVSDGTDTHLLLVDLKDRDFSGNKAAKALIQAGICCNRNMVPGDTRPPMQTSGIRIGSPFMTTLGFEEAEMREVARWIKRVLSDIKDEDEIAKVKSEVNELCSKFPHPEFLL
jgi:glycine hydroxymethyltransferase